MTMLTNDELQAIRARCAAATLGPWIHKVETYEHCNGISEADVVTYPDGRYVVCEPYSFSGGSEVASFIAHARTDIPALLDHIEHLNRVYTIPCPYCDFGSSQLGMDRCQYCDGSGRMDVHAFVAQQRDVARAEVDEQKAALEQAWYVLDSAAAGVAPKVAAIMARANVEKFIGARESNFDDTTKEAPMPKELKLLPCPACGEVASLVHNRRQFWVTCLNLEGMKKGCYLTTGKYATQDDAITAWNSLPRALTWTKEPPQVAGHYWCRYKSDSKEAWSVAYVPAVTDWGKRDMEEHDRIEWAGPIPMPKEPTP